MLTRRTQRATDARQEWSRRFEHAHALAFSSDLKEAASGLKLIEALSRELQKDYARNATRTMDRSRKLR